VKIVAVTMKPMEIQFVVLQMSLVRGTLLSVVTDEGRDELVLAAKRLTAAVKQVLTI
jgi:hypothetical protein